MSTLKSAAEKCAIKVECVETIIAQHHEYEVLMTKKELKKLVVVPIDMNKDTAKYVRNLAKTLKVSEDAAIVGILKWQLEKSENKKVDKTKKAHKIMHAKSKNGGDA